MKYLHFFKQSGRALLLILATLWSITQQVNAQTSCTRYTAANTNIICPTATWQPYGLFIGGTLYNAADVKFTTNPNGTATLTGTYRDANWSPITVNVLFSGGTATAPSGSPKRELCATANTPVADWFYYPTFTGTLQFGTAAPVNLTRRGPSFQTGTGANLQNNDQFGGSGWFTLSDGREGDFNLKLQNPTPVACNAVDPCNPDVTAPTFRNCPANIAIATAPGATGATATWTAPTAEDNCSNGHVGNVLGTNLSGDFFNIGTRTVSYTATDAAGNRGTCSFTVTVSSTPPTACNPDVTPPTFVDCPANITIATTATSVIATWTPPASRDNCASSTTVVSSAQPGVTSFPTGTTTVTYTATDDVGNRGTCSFTVTVQTSTPPPNGSCTLYSATNTNTICPTATYQPYGLFIGGTLYNAADVKFKTNPNGTATLTGTFRDANWTPITVNVQFAGGTATAPSGSPKRELCVTASTSVTDWFYYPTYTGTLQFGTAAPVTVTRRGPSFQTGTGANLQNNNLFGGSGWFTLGDGREGDFNFKLENPTTVACNAVDPCNPDVTAPTFTNCPANITVTAAAGAVSTAVTWTPPTAEDNCGNGHVGNVLGTALPGNFFNIGTTSVSYTATDAAGNRGTCSFTVTVTAPTVNPCNPDVTAPTFTNCPANFSVSTANINTPTATVTWTPPTAEDNCSTGHLSNVVATAQPGATFAVGSYTVSYTATDAAGNRGTCSFVVTVTNPSCNPDVTAPRFVTCPSNVTVSTNTTTATVTWPQPTAVDNCTPQVSVTNISGVPGPTFPVGTSLVTYLAIDSDGNRALCTFSVTVNRTVDPCNPDVTAPRFVNCPANITVSTAGTTATATWTAPIAEDNCSTGHLNTVTASAQPGASFPVGNTTVTYTAIDAAGNRATCTFTVTVNQTCTANAGTVAVANANLTLVNGSASIVGTPTTNSTVPSGYSVLYVLTKGSNLIIQNAAATPNFTVTTVGDYRVHVLVYNPNTLSLSGIQFGVTSAVTINALLIQGGGRICASLNVAGTPVAVNAPVDPCNPDVTAPRFVNCPANVTVTAAAGATSAKATWTAPTAEDNCSTGHLTNVTATATSNSTLFPIGNTIVTYTAKDAANNTAICTFTVTVLPLCNIPASVKSCINTKTSCGTATPYVVFFNNKYYTAGSDLKFTENANGTATLIGKICYNNYCYPVNVAFSGRTCVAPTSSPKYDLCANAQNTNNAAGWYYYTTTSGTVGTADGVQTIERDGPSFQIGNFANLQENKFGASGWFKTPVGTRGDFNFNLGNVAVCPDNKLHCNYWMNHYDWNSPNKVPTTTPTREDWLENGFEYQPANNHYADNYMMLVQGYITFPTAGNYQFRVSGDDYVDLYLSNDDQVATNNRICSITGWTFNDEYSKYPSQMSSNQYRNANQKCYVELRMKEGVGSDHFRVQWKRPNSNVWETCPSSVLSAYCPPAAQYATSNRAAVTLDASLQLNQVKLMWVNNSAPQNDFFVVQKLDIAAGEFKDIEFIQAPNSTDQSLKTYTTIDRTPNEGDNLYRIKVVFYDGNSIISDTRRVTYSKTTGVQLFPNPATDVLSVALLAYHGNDVDLYIHDQFGQLVHQQSVENVGKAAIDINIENFTSGNYLLRVVSKGRRDAVKKFVIIK